MFKILQKEKVLSISDGWPDSSPEKDSQERNGQDPTAHIGAACPACS